MSRDPIVFEAFGVQQAEEFLQGIADRLTDISGAQPAIDQALDAAYQVRFERWRGYMVETGATRAAFTSDGASNAIRDAHHDAIVFGSNVEYDVFHARELLRVTPSMEAAISDSLIDFYAPDHEPLGHPLAPHMPDRP